MISSDSTDGTQSVTIAVLSPRAGGRCPGCRMRPTNHQKMVGSTAAWYARARLTVSASHSVPALRARHPPDPELRAHDHPQCAQREVGGALRARQRRDTRGARTPGSGAANRGRDAAPAALGPWLLPAAARRAPGLGPTGLGARDPAARAWAAMPPGLDLLSALNIPLPPARRMSPESSRGQNG